jgi:hypothetical protein
MLQHPERLNGLLTVLPSLDLSHSDCLADAFGPSGNQNARDSVLKGLRVAIDLPVHYH